MKIVFECQNCKVSQVENPKEAKEKTEVYKGQSIDLKYYECPVCKSKNYVQADNEQSKEWLSKILRLTKTQISANRAGRRGKNTGKAKKIQIHLRKVRNELQKELEHDGFNFAEYKIVGDDYAAGM